MASLLSAAAKATRFLRQNRELVKLGAAAVPYVVSGAKYLFPKYNPSNKLRWSSKNIALLKSKGLLKMPRRGPGRPGRRMGVRRRSFVGKRRFPRKRFVRKGKYRVGNVRGTIQPDTKWRGPRDLYQQPSARRRKTGGNLRLAGQKFKCSIIERVQIGTSGAEQDLVFTGRASYLTCNRNSYTPVPDETVFLRCPEFYRIIKDWGSLTMTGYKMEIFSQPSFRQSGGIITASGRAWSTVGEYTSGDFICSPNVAPLPGVGPVPGHDIRSYNGIEDASLRDKAFRAEKLRLAISSIRLPTRPVRWFSRYAKFEVTPHQQRGMWLIQNAGNDPIVQPLLSTIPIAPQQDISIQVRLDDFANTSTPLYFDVKHTLYFTCYDKSDMSGLEIPPWAYSRHEQATVLANVPILDDPSETYHAN